MFKLTLCVGDSQSQSTIIFNISGGLPSQIPLNSRNTQIRNNIDLYKMCSLEGQNNINLYKICTPGSQNNINLYKICIFGPKIVSIYIKFAFWTKNNINLYKICIFGPKIISIYIKFAFSGNQNNINLYKIDFWGYTLNLQIIAK